MWRACHLQKWDMGALACQQKWGRGCKLEGGFGHIPFCLPASISVYAHKIWCWCLKEAVVSHHPTCTRAFTISFCYCVGIWCACAHYWCKYQFWTLGRQPPKVMDPHRSSQPFWGGLLGLFDSSESSLHVRICHVNLSVVELALFLSLCFFILHPCTMNWLPTTSLARMAALHW